MRDVEAFHPDLRSLARLLPRGGISERTLPALRAAQRLTGLRHPADATRIDLGPAALWLLRPPGPGPHPAVLWIHGGGYVMGQAAQDLSLCRELVRRLGVAVAAVEYRLAPEHPFPAPLEDCVTAWHWVTAQPWVAPDRVAVAGASAGGGLAAALAQRLAGSDGVRPALQLLVYPMLDDRTAADGVRRPVPLRLWDERANRFGWRSLLGHDPGGESTDPLAAPARARDLSALAPAWVGVGTCDLFHDEDVAHARRLAAAGVPCQLEVVPGAFHGFDLVAPRTPVARAFRAAQHRALADALGC